MGIEKTDRLPSRTRQNSPDPTRVRLGHCGQLRPLDRAFLILQEFFRDEKKKLGILTFWGRFKDISMHQYQNIRSPAEYRLRRVGQREKAESKREK